MHRVAGTGDVTTEQAPQRQLSLPDRLLHRLSQFIEAQEIGDAAAIFAEALGKLRLRESELIHQCPISGRAVHGV